MIGLLDEEGFPFPVDELIDIKARLEDDGPDRLPSLEALPEVLHPRVGEELLRPEQERGKRRGKAVDDDVFPLDQVVDGSHR